MPNQHRFRATALSCRTAALAAVFIAAAAASPALATQYRFADLNGNLYCDGLLLTFYGQAYHGIHNSPNNDCTEGGYAGGFKGKGFNPGISGDGLVVNHLTHLATIMTSDLVYAGTGYVLVLNMDLAAMRWNLWAEGPGMPFTLTNGGILLSPLEAGAVAARRPALHRPVIAK